MKLFNFPIYIDNFSCNKSTLNIIKDDKNPFFLLSHAHLDHTNGLTKKWNKGIIYISFN